MTPVGALDRKPSVLMRMALEKALGEAGLPLREFHGLIAVPSLAQPRFMAAHDLAPQRKVASLRAEPLMGPLPCLWELHAH